VSVLIGIFSKIQKAPRPPSGKRQGANQVVCEFVTECSANHDKRGCLEGLLSLP